MMTTSKAKKKFLKGKTIRKETNFFEGVYRGLKIYKIVFKSKKI